MYQTSDYMEALAWTSEGRAARFARLLQTDTVVRAYLCLDEPGNDEDTGERGLVLHILHTCSGVEASVFVPDRFVDPIGAFF